MRPCSKVPNKNCKYALKLTSNQINLVTTALFEYAGVCWEDSDLNGGRNMALVRLAKDMTKTRHSILLQENKERVKRGHVQQLNKYPRRK